MLKTIVLAAQNFVQHQLESSCTIQESAPKMRTLVAYIDTVSQDATHHRVYVACEENLMQQIAELFLGEEQSDEATLRDMSLEVANMVIGSAKVIAEESNSNPFSIATPHFEKFDNFDFDYDEQQVLDVNGNLMIIAVKGL